MHRLTKGDGVWRNVKKVICYFSTLNTTAGQPLLYFSPSLILFLPQERNCDLAFDKLISISLRPSPSTLPLILAFCGDLIDFFFFLAFTVVSWCDGSSPPLQSFWFFQTELEEYFSGVLLFRTLLPTQTHSSHLMDQTHTHSHTHTSFVVCVYTTYIHIQSLLWP